MRGLEEEDDDEGEEEHFSFSSFSSSTFSSSSSLKFKRFSSFMGKISFTWSILQCCMSDTLESEIFFRSLDIQML